MKSNERKKEKEKEKYEKKYRNVCTRVAPGEIHNYFRRQIFLEARTRALVHTRRRWNFMEILERPLSPPSASFKFHYLEHRLNDTSLVSNDATKTYLVCVGNKLGDNKCRSNVRTVLLVVPTGLMYVERR